MTEKKKILITGATGFIGQSTVLALAEEGWHITQGTRSDSDGMPEGVVFLNLEDPASLIALEKGPRFDAIVHLGARVDLSSEMNADMFTSNVLSTGCLTYLAKFWKAHFIYASTAIVHGGRTENINIESPIDLDTVYAKSKYLGEQLLAASNIKHCILRIVGVYGCDGPAHLGLNRAINGAMKGEAPIQIGTGSALRNYIYVKDVAQAIVYALQQNLSGVHLLAGHEVLSFAEMLKQICDTFASGIQPVIKDGTEAMNQVVNPSSYLPQTRSFQDALFDLQKGCQ